MGTLPVPMCEELLADLCFQASALRDLSKQKELVGRNSRRFLCGGEGLELEGREN